MKLLLAARVAPTGMIGFFEEMAQGGARAAARPCDVSVDSHPSPSERIARLRGFGRYRRDRARQQPVPAGRRLARP